MAVLKYKTKNGEYKTLDMIIAGGGSGTITPVQELGDSETDVISQKVVTDSIGNIRYSSYVSTAELAITIGHFNYLNVSSTANYYTSEAVRVPISSSVNSTNTMVLATSVAVKTAYDRADSAYNLADSKTANTGTVTSVTAGTGLSGGTITTRGTISLATSGVTAGSAGPTAAVTGSNGTTVAIPRITVDTYGRVTGLTSYNYTSVNTDNNTTYSAGTGLSLSGTTFNHASSVTAGTAGTSSATSGATLSIPYVTVNATGHVTGYGTHTHTISGFSTTDTKVTQTSYTSSVNLPLLCATTTSPNGSAYGSYYNAGVYANLSTKYLYAAGFFQTSDENFKNYQGDIEIDFEKLKLIPKKYFTWKEGENKDLQIGTSAQKVREIYPEIVSEDDKLHVDYSKLSVIALAAIDKLYEENKELKERIIKLEEKVYGNIN